eukprot:12480813-Alexandrium_andersonii.AAC.1
MSGRRVWPRGVAWHIWVTGSQGLAPTDFGGPLLTTVQWRAVPGPSLEQNAHRHDSITVLPLL